MSDDRFEPERVTDLGEGMALYRVHVDALREQDVNARAMQPAMFERLTQTISRDGRLESLPLVALTDKGLEIVSGHHRVRAARAGGVSIVYALVDETGLTRDQIAAKQLAHNSIAGHDEAQLLAQIYENIRDVDARLEAFIDDRELANLPDKVALPPLDLKVDYRSVLITFLPGQHDMFERAVQNVLDQANLDRDDLYIADLELYERWNALMRRLRKEYGVKASGSAIARFLDVAADTFGLDPTDPDPEGWVPLADIFGSAVVPPDAAEVLQNALTRMLDSDDVTPKARWRAIEFWAADYLGG